MNTSEVILQQVQDIEASGCLGKSDLYAKLLRYLAERSASGNRPKEIEIAIDVFGRDQNFDVAQDALVRVYIHKLRRKLETYYRDLGRPHEFRLEIPKGSYQLELIPVSPGADLNPGASESPSPSNERQKYLKPTLALIILLLLANLFLITQRPSLPSVSKNAEQLAQSPIWADLLQDKRPLLIVLGDLFVFSELNAQFEEIREIRDQRINSDIDLALLQAHEPELRSQYRSFGASYFPKSTMYALNYVLPVLQAGGKDMSFRLMSRLTEEEINNNNLLFIGFFNSLRQLEKMTFSASRFSLHPSYLLLIDKETGNVFAGEGDINESYSDRYLDYGLFSKYRGQNGNHILVFGAIRNAGLAYTTGAMTSAEQVQRLEAQLLREGIDPQGNFEVLYEISGFDYDSLNSKASILHRLSPPAEEMKIEAAKN